MSEEKKEEKGLPEGFKIIIKDDINHGTTIDQSLVRFEWQEDIASGAVIEYGKDGLPVYGMVKRARAASCYLDYMAFACCGAKVMSSVNHLFAFPALQCRAFLQELIDKLFPKVTNGGNIMFVIGNGTHRAQCLPMLKLMAEMGKLTETEFYNFNARRPNYMYTWTYKGDERGWRKMSERKVDVEKQK